MFGPGESGWWPDCKDPLRKSGWKDRKIELIRKFHEDIQNGDLIVLRLGTKEVHGVGAVESDPKWHDDFGDIDGWDLQFVRRVRWLWMSANDEPKIFNAHALKLGGTVQKLRREGAVYEWLLDTPAQNLDLPVLPDSFCAPKERVPRIELPKVSEYLFDQGIAAGAINNLAENMRGLQQIASWYLRSGEAPSETETLAYLTVPLLRTLGWTPQRMAVEWNRIDIALFDGLPRNDATLAVVVEVKKFGSSCLSAATQAADYARQPDRDKCGRLIVTDGIRYGVYLKDSDGTFPDTPNAYMNLNRMVGDYPALGCGGTPDVLKLLAADWCAN